MVCSRHSKNVPPPYEKFLKALVEAHIPESVIKTKTALNEYMKLKHDNEKAFNNDEVSLTAARLNNDVKSKLHSRDWEAPL